MDCWHDLRNAHRSIFLAITDVADAMFNPEIRLFTYGLSPPAAPGDNGLSKPL
jgi:hypothetical protein